MADMEKTKLRKVATLLEHLRELQAKQYALTEELRAVLDGAPGIGDRLKALERAWSTLWQGRYGAPYMWTYTKDRPQMKRLALALDQDDLEARFATYLRDEDVYYVQRRHPFGLFVTNVNRYATAGHALIQDELLDTPGDCRHTPRCGSEQEHTKRAAQDLRR